MRGDPARRALVTLADVYSACGSRPMEFVRAFKGRAGLSPHQWLFQRRIPRALELPRDPNRSFAEIALLTEFPDQGTFARIFVRKTGRALRSDDTAGVAPLTACSRCRHGVHGNL
ncbi:helix-turn-helix domain-containing protein [Paraburkholderia sp. BL10I2N1]|uniref:helix-turn-helix domain-containing protein n=1 Tax=Paraburkholderia sp. BL10I2N1 TaxID=1938796 RepID=UPI00105E917B|nr:helix-turn-helix domain-containing protein [Paraburkholderia sp. BL10I2N1]